MEHFATLMLFDIQWIAAVPDVMASCSEREQPSIRQSDQRRDPVAASSSFIVSENIYRNRLVGRLQRSRRWGGRWGRW